MCFPISLHSPKNSGKQMQERSHKKFFIFHLGKRCKLFSFKQKQKWFKCLSLLSSPAKLTQNLFHHLFGKFMHNLTEKIARASFLSTLLPQPLLHVLKLNAHFEKSWQTSQQNCYTSHWAMLCNFWHKKLTQLKNRKKTRTKNNEIERNQKKKKKQKEKRETNEKESVTFPYPSPLSHLRKGVKNNF